MTNLKTIYKLIAAFALVACTFGMTSCSDSKSYAELLTDENHAVNLFLVDQRVSTEVPTDSTFNFETGPDAPYYPLDEDGNVYMQVITRGTGPYATSDEIIYFRYTRYNLNYYKNGELPAGDGNETNMSDYNAWFRYNNYQLQSSYQWGAGIQLPLGLLPIDSNVNLIIKSQYGFYSETSYVIPFLYKVRYYRQRT